MHDTSAVRRQRLYISLCQKVSSVSVRLFATTVSWACFTFRCICACCTIIFTFCTQSRRGPLAGYCKFVLTKNSAARKISHNTNCSVKGPPPILNYSITTSENGLFLFQLRNITIGAFETYFCDFCEICDKSDLRNKFA